VTTAAVFPAASRGTSRGPGACSFLEALGILSRPETTSVQAERLGRRAALMVRRRSTVRFRKGALQVRDQIRTTSGTTSCSKVGLLAWCFGCEPRSWMQGGSVKAERCVFDDPTAWPLGPTSLSVTVPGPGSRAKGLAKGYGRQPGLGRDFVHGDRRARTARRPVRRPTSASACYAGERVFSLRWAW
jgi:hypothetical protein